MKSPIASRVLFGALLTATLSACGSTGVSGVPATTQPQADGGVVTYVPGPSGGSVPAYSYSFITYGKTPKTVTESLLTDNKLVVKIRADRATKIDYDSAFTAYYHCAQFRIQLQTEVGGVWKTLREENTGMLNVAGTSGCSGGVASQTYDWSAYLIPGHGDVRINVIADGYDYFCNYYKSCMSNYSYYYSASCSWVRNYGPTMEQYVCPSHYVQDNHSLNGTIEAQINGTQFQP
jgi:hypothetical protein